MSSPAGRIACGGGCPRARLAPIARAGGGRGEGRRTRGKGGPGGRRLLRGQEVEDSQEEEGDDALGTGKKLIRYNFYDKIILGFSVFTYALLVPWSMVIYTEGSRQHRIDYAGQ